MRRTTRGFTLIELLVVITIIAILASILFPVFSRARAKARQTACLSNVKQLSLAINMYTQDYDEMLIPSRQGFNGGPLGLIWPAYLSPYARNTQVFTCPDAKGRSYYAETWNDRGRLSIGLNRDIEDRNTNIAYALSMFEYPSETIVLADSTPGNTGSPEKMRGYQVMADREPDTKSGVGARHSSGTNVGFLDGHAKWYKASSIWQLNNPAGLRWQP